jgi:hypothetical protein
MLSGTAVERTGTVRSTVQEMASGALAFIDAPGLTRYDPSGFSQRLRSREVALIQPHQVRRIVLAGTGP